ncbi:MAG TPA: L-tyrosine/L-tryptophan isonitrile synthase family protein [Candidatus Babeliales bacterium]|nr:L-tyrosine/L-tryptophan isonitrile synthase family protein [Candidatus Babeliales bacterium]
MHLHITALVAVCSYGLIYSSELPLITEKYRKTIPSLVCNGSAELSAKEKASLITHYLTGFIPHKKSLAIEGTEQLQNKIKDLIDHEKPLSLLLLGFPFKSTNHEKKCLSDDVDMGEYLALTTLNTVVDNIKQIYPHAHCTIISDGLAYHIEEYDPSYQKIVNYHDQMDKLTQLFDHVSFISWNINGTLSSYNQLQAYVDQTLCNDDKKNTIRIKEMSSFVKNEFESTNWQAFFLQQAEDEYNKTGSTIKPKLKAQEIKTLKNKLIMQKISCVVPELIKKGKQFSTLVSQIYPNYNECIRLSVHCDKNNPDISCKIPIALIYGHYGTPWHNTMVINQDDELKGFAKDIYKKQLDLSLKPKKEYSVKTNETLNVAYITF